MSSITSSTIVGSNKSSHQCYHVAPYMRRRSANEPPSQARDARPVETDARIVRIERLLQDVAKSVDVLSKRLVALESQVDYLASKIRPS